MIKPISNNPFYFGTGLMLDLDFKKKPNHRTDLSTITDSEVKRIKKIILESKKQGLSEISIDIKKDQWLNSKAEIGTMFESLPLNLSYDIDNKKNGTCTLNIKLQPKTIPEEMREWKSLYDDGIIDEDQFNKAKENLIEKINSASK